MDPIAYGRLKVSTLILDPLRERRPEWRAHERSVHSKFLAGFDWNGRTLPYFYHPYHRTWMSERTVEVPVIWDCVRRGAPPFLEIGNVLSHYFDLPADSTVLDKYERAPGVVHDDVVNYAPTRPFRTIVSISTLEHVGLDEPQKEPEKVLRGIERLSQLLAPGGEAWFTVPLGYNLQLNEYIRTQRLPLTARWFLRRVSADNRWAECSAAEALAVPYNKRMWEWNRVDPPFPYANSIMVGWVRNA